MKILSIDTSSNICGVSVLEDEKLLKEFSEDNKLTHSERLVPIIKDLLSELKLDLCDFDLIVCDIGPGSFTGIRIGVATVKAFCDSLNINSIGISSLEALAYNTKQEGLICSLIDAKHNNVYVGVFKREHNKLNIIRSFSAENISDILKELISFNSPITFVGDGAIVYKDLILEFLPNSFFEINNDLSSYNLGLAGLNNYKYGKVSDVLPLYLKKPQAELNFKGK